MRFTCWICVLPLLAGCGSKTPAAPGQQQVANNAAADSDADDTPQSAKTGAVPAVPSTADATESTPVDPAFSASDDADEGIHLSAEEWVARADDLLSARDLIGAKNALDRALRVDPELVDARIKRAAILGQNGYPGPAIDDISVAIEHRQDDARLRNTRGYFYLSLGKYDAALKDFNDAIAIDLKFAQPYNNRGLTRIALGDFETALRDFDAALELDPEYHDAHNNRGLALMQLERYDEAVEAFSTAIELKPDYSGTWNNRGLARHRAGEHAAAIEDFTKAIELQPQTLKFWMHRSVAREAAGDETGAKEDLSHAVWLRTLVNLTRSLQQSPRDASRWVARGRHYLEGDELDLALQDFDRAVVLDVSCTDAYSGRAAVYLRQGDAERAIHECTRAIERAPHHEAFSLRGDAYFEQGDYDHAIEDYSAARRLDARVARAYLLRSREHKAAGEIEQASADYERAVSLDPDLAEEEEATPVDTPANEAPQQ